MRISDWSSDVCSSDLADRKQGIGQAPGAWKLQIGILSEKGVPAAFSSRNAHLDEIVRTIFRHFNSSGVQNGHAGDKRCEQVRTLLRGQRYQQPAAAGAGDRALSRVQIGRAARRERGGQYGQYQWDGGHL